MISPVLELSQHTERIFPDMAAAASLYVRQLPLRSISIFQCICSTSLGVLLGTTVLHTYLFGYSKGTRYDDNDNDAIIRVCESD